VRDTLDSDLRARVKDVHLVRELIEAIIHGKATVEIPKGDSPYHLYSGDYDYIIHQEPEEEWAAPFDGWVVCVFIDCGDWDYIDHVRAPDGRVWDFDLLFTAAREQYQMKDLPIWGLR
jgi:hypothetical protein